jgi:hypothetical protein
MQRVLRILSVVCAGGVLLQVGFLVHTYKLTDVGGVLMSGSFVVIRGLVAVPVLLAAAQVLDSLERIAARLERLEDQAGT